MMPIEARAHKFRPAALASALTLLMPVAAAAQ